MQRMVGTARELAVDDDEILHIRHLARQHDAIGGKTQFLRLARTVERGGDERIAHHRISVARRRGLRIDIHHAREQRGIEAAPVDADPHRLVVANGVFDHHGELRIALAALADVAGIDPVFGECAGAFRKFGQQLVAVEMKIANQRNGASLLVERGADRRHGGGSLRRVDGDAHDLRARLGECAHLRHGGGNVYGIGVGHRLHDDRRTAADRDGADHDLPRPAARG